MPAPHQNDLMIYVKAQYPMGSATPIAFPVPLSRNIAPNSSGQYWVAQEDIGSSGQAFFLELELRRALLQTTNGWKYAGVHQKCPTEAFQILV